MKRCTCCFKTFLALIGLTLCFSSLAQAQDLTLESLIERQKLQDLITRYYYNFGGTPESFANFYVEDGELILIGQSFKGRAAIATAYTRPGGEAPQNLSFNSLVSNLLITVNGDTATAQLVWTENVIQNQGDPVHIPFQGREYSNFVKVDGEWKYQTRNVIIGTAPPQGWGE
jgi:hypothetical protein